MRRSEVEGSDARQLIAGILLAAGQSVRFGRQKLLEPWQGEPLVRRSATAFLDGGLSPLIVVVSDDLRFAGALEGLPLTTVVNHQSEQGISASIAVGVMALPEAVQAALIGVADQPNVDRETIQALTLAFKPERIVVPRYGDHGGNPVIFDRRFFPELLALSGDRGGQLVVADHPEAVTEVRLDPSIGEDVDRPQQWRG